MRLIDQPNYQSASLVHKSLFYAYSITRA